MLKNARYYLNIFHLYMNNFLTKWSIPINHYLGCGLKNRLSDFFKNFCICNIHVIPSIFKWKKHTSLWLKWNGGHLKICAQYSRFYMKYIGKYATFRTKFRKYWKIDIWYLHGYCLYFSKKKEGVTVKILRRGYLKHWKCVKWEEVSKTRVKCFIPLIKVNIINLDYDHDHDILHQF